MKTKAIYMVQTPKARVSVFYDSIELTTTPMVKKFVRKRLETQYRRPYRFLTDTQIKSMTLQILQAIVLDVRNHSKINFEWPGLDTAYVNGSQCQITNIHSWFKRVDPSTPILRTMVKRSITFVFNRQSGQEIPATRADILAAQVVMDSGNDSAILAHIIRLLDNMPALSEVMLRALKDRRAGEQYPICAFDYFRFECQDESIIYLCTIFGDRARVAKWPRTEVRGPVKFNEMPKRTRYIVLRALKQIVP